ncbi:hypothetical protein D3C81_966760 [compost metagenome]
MAFDLEYNRLVVADIDDPSAFARPHQHAWTAGGKPPQQRLRIFVGTVFGPHDAKHADFRIIRLAPEEPANQFVFAVGNAHLFVNFLLRNLFCIWFLSGHLLTHADPSKLSKWM